MKNSVKIWLDLDGTVYDLYNINNWEPRLRAEDPTVFEDGDFIGDYDRFISICNPLVSCRTSYPDRQSPVPFLPSVPPYPEYREARTTPVAAHCIPYSRTIPSAYPLPAKPQTGHSLLSGGSYVSPHHINSGKTEPTSHNKPHPPVFLMISPTETYTIPYTHTPRFWRYSADSGYSPTPHSRTFSRFFAQSSGICGI